MSLFDPECAAQNAYWRAMACRSRLEELQSRKPVTAQDLEQARHRLGSARVRALAATARGAARRSGVGSQVSTLRQLVHVSDLPEPLVAQLDSGRVSLADLSVAYLGLGGSCTTFEIDGYVNGALRLPLIEAQLLGQALAELE